MMQKWKKLYRRHRVIVGKWIGRLIEDDVPAYAAQAAFYIIIASVPFIMLLVTLARYFIPLTRTGLTSFVMALFPESFRELVTQIVGELFVKSPASVISITAVTALWSASRGVIAMCRGLNRVYHVEERRNYVTNRGMSLLYTLLFVLLLLCCLVILVFGNNVLSMMEGAFPLLSRIFSLFVRFRALFFITILSLFFASLYKFLPVHRVLFRRQLPGAVFAAVGWNVFSYFYGIYIENYSNYSYIYGSLTAIVLLMLWLYVCMMLVLLGAEFNEFLDEHVIRSEKEVRRKVRGGWRR